MPAFVQVLLTGNSKTSSTSLVLSGSKTVTAGNDIFVSFTSDDVGSAFSATDNLGNVYTLIRMYNTSTAGFIKTHLFQASNVIGGELTSITVSWTTSITAKAAVSGEFSGVGLFLDEDGDGGATEQIGWAAHGVMPWLSGDLLVAAVGYQAPSTDLIEPRSTGAIITHEVIQDGTTGGSAASNMTASLMYVLATVPSGVVENAACRNLTSSSRWAAVACARYSPLPSLGSHRVWGLASVAPLRF